MSGTSLNKLSNLLLFKHKYSMHQSSNEKKGSEQLETKTQITLDSAKKKFLEKTREGRYEDADVEDNTNSEEDIDTSDYTFNKSAAFNQIHEDCLSDVFLTTRSNSPLCKEQRYNLESLDTGNSYQKLPYPKSTKAKGLHIGSESKYLDNMRPKSINSSPLLIHNKHLDRRQSAPVSLETHHYTKGQIVDQMEKEQERVVLKLIKQIHQLKNENQQLKKELQQHQQLQKHSSSVKKNNSISSSSSRDSTYTHHRSLSSASTVYNPRQNSLTSATIRDTVLTDFEVLK